MKMQSGNELAPGKRGIDFIGDFCLRAAVYESIARYLDTLEGEMPANLYQLVIQEMERGLFSAVMSECRGNQSAAAKTLSMSRATLRAKLQEYALLHYGKHELQ